MRRSRFCDARPIALAGTTMMRERYLHLPPENEFGWIAATGLVLRQSQQRT
jgi:hypothetical protein